MIFATRQKSELAGIVFEYGICLNDFYGFETEEDFKAAQDATWAETGTRMNLVQSTWPKVMSGVGGDPIRFQVELHGVKCTSFMSRSAWERDQDEKRFEAELAARAAEAKANPYVRHEPKPRFSEERIAELVALGFPEADLRAQNVTA